MKQEELKKRFAAIADELDAAKADLKIAAAGRYDISRHSMISEAIRNAGNLLYRLAEDTDNCASILEFQ